MAVTAPEPICVAVIAPDAIEVVVTAPLPIMVLVIAPLAILIVWSEPPSKKVPLFNVTPLPAINLPLIDAPPPPVADIV